MAKAVLIVNDSKITTRMVIASLKDEGYDFATAENGEEALELIDMYQFDLVITDLNMPEIDGIELTKAIRTKSNSKYIPVIFISGEENNEKLKEAKLAGSSAWLPLPVNKKILISTIYKFLR